MPPKRKVHKNSTSNPNVKTLSCAMIVQDESSIIGYSIESVLQCCDEVIIIDGISQDNTEHIIKAKAKDLGCEQKLKYFKNRFVNFNEQRNYYLKHASCDFLMYLDADEIITEEHIKNIRKRMETHELILIKSHHFYIDFYHIITSGNWDYSFLMPRCFRNLKGKLSYTPYTAGKGDHELMVNIQTPCRNYWMGKSIVCEKDEAVVYHYGYALSKDKQIKKMKTYMQYAKTEVKMHPYFDEQIWKEGINPNPLMIQQFNGRHPEIMKNHPLYNTKIIKDK